uniref:Putative secreted protein n=1 Tax=Anopheles darlingi TaxID=43151 RepID=A0A2M4DAS7_ANODA
MLGTLLWPFLSHSIRAYDYTSFRFSGSRFVFNQNCTVHGVRWWKMKTRNRHMITIYLRKVEKEQTLIHENHLSHERRLTKVSRDYRRLSVFFDTNYK